MYILDTSIFISFIRHGKYENFLFETIRNNNCYIPSPVLSELYAVARSTKDNADLDIFKQSLVNYIREPNIDDWIIAGKCIAIYLNTYGKIKPSHHIIDLLICIIASNTKYKLVTENLSDMQKWKNILKEMSYNLEIVSLN